VQNKKKKINGKDQAGYAFPFASRNYICSFLFCREI